MENRKRNRRKTNKTGSGIQDLITTVKDPKDIDEQDWYLDSQDVRLTKIFSVVLALHIIAIGGILAFKMFDRNNQTAAIAQASSRPNQTETTQRVLAGRVDADPIPVSLNVIEPVPQPQYQVIPGDTLIGIANKLGVSVRALQVENNINSVDGIFEGMILRVPESKTFRPIPMTDHSKLPEHPTRIVSQGDYMKETSESGQVYRVQIGDTAWGIAEKFNVDYKQLLRLNNIDRAEELQVGRMLSVPAR